MSIVIEQPEIFRENIRKALGKFFEDEKWCHNIEKGVFNYTIKEADMRKITKKYMTQNNENQNHHQYCHCDK